MRYPRDFDGYGKDPPIPNWPGNASIAVQFVINYEEGGENCILHGDQASESFLSEIINAEPWPNQRHWNMESIYEYGARSGFWRLHKIFTELEVPVTIFGVASALARAPQQVSAMKSAQWEIASHGLKWIDYRNLPKQEEIAHHKDAIKIHRAVTGDFPRGWYLGRCSENTVDIISEFSNFEYISDAYNDDLPYWLNRKDKAQLIIPYTLDANDMRFATAQGFNNGSQFYDYLKDTFDLLLTEGRNGYPKMMTIGLHCRLAGRPGRALAVKRFIDYIRSYSDVWIAKRIEIAEHWKIFHPPKFTKSLPYNLSRDEFVKKFGNVFENSPWVAERAYNHEISPAMNSVTGLHAALCFQFRIASEKDRLDVLTKHPDLAGKLAREEKLTKESISEQKSVGLNNLTQKELNEFSNLNREYTTKFKHPFIMAVTGSTKEKIITSFRSRVMNSPTVELQTACKEVEKIALIRVRNILNTGD